MIESILWVLFTLVCILVSALVLLQEGKGGGLGDAFGGAGAQTFGVKAGGVSKVTGYLVASLILMAIAITKIRSGDTGVASLLDQAPVDSAPADPGAGAAPAAPADPATQPPGEGN